MEEMEQMERNNRFLLSHGGEEGSEEKSRRGGVKKHFVRGEVEDEKGARRVEG